MPTPEDLLNATNAVLDVFADSMVSVEVGQHLNCGEAATLVELFDAAGRHHDGQMFLYGHSVNDSEAEGDAHVGMTEPEAAPLGSVDVVYTTSVYATVDLATATVTKVTVADGDCEMQVERTRELIANGGTPTAEQTARLDAAIDVAESAVWPGWDFG